MDFADDGAEGAFVVGTGFEGEAHADDFEGVREEDADHACETAACEASAGGFLGFVLDYAGAYLFVCKEFDAGVGEDAEEGCGVAFEKTSNSSTGIYVADCGREARPRASIFCELGVVCLE